MTRNVPLTITSLLSILFLSFHLSDDIVRGFEKGGVSTFIGVAILVAFLYTTLVLADRRWGLVLLLLLSVAALGVPYIHMTGKGLAGGRIAGTSGMFFWVWTLIALGVTAAYSAILAARALWSLRRSQSPSRAGE